MINVIRFEEQDQTVLVTVIARGKDNKSIVETIDSKPHQYCVPTYSLGNCVGYKGRSPMYSVPTALLSSIR